MIANKEFRLPVPQALWCALLASECYKHQERMLLVYCLVCDKMIALSVRILAASDKRPSLQF